MSDLCEDDFDPIAALNKAAKKKKDAKRKKELRAVRREGNAAKQKGRRPKSFEYEDGVKVRNKLKKAVEVKSKSIEDVPRRTPRFQATGILEDVEALLNPLVPDDPSSQLMDTQESQTVWQERMARQDEVFRLLRQDFPKTVIERSHMEKSGCCSHCHSSGCVVACSTCRATLCNSCDRYMHLKLIDHQRRCLVKKRLHTMLPTEFISIENGDLERLDVHMPVLTPTRCGSCNVVRSLRPTVGKNKTSFISNAGRFDISTTAFQCSNAECNIIREATTLEYISSGYWPGSATNTNYFFDEFLLEKWYHERHKTPGTSEQKFVEHLEEISSENQRVNSINRVLFNRSRKEYEFCMFSIKLSLLKRYGSCKGCGDKPHGHHADANMKLYRFSSARDRQCGSLYGNLIMASDEDMLNHIHLIESRIPRKDKQLSCGNSTFTAGRSDSGGKSKLDITGLEVMSCTHGSVVYSANLFKGETYKHTHLQHLKSSSLGARFFSNDVVCKYWPFAQKIAAKFPERPEFQKAVDNMLWHLSRFHGWVHGWDCRVLHLGHWISGAADFLGEEQEQNFAILGRRASSNKHMSRDSRRDDVSASCFYLNEEKDRKLPKYLVKCYHPSPIYHTAVKRAPEYESKLDDLLKRRNLKRESLPVIHEKLKAKARCVRNKDKPVGSIWELDVLQAAIEGEAHAMKLMKQNNEKFLDNNKARTRNRHAMSKKKDSITKLAKSLHDLYEVVVNPEHIDSGLFPWHDGNTVTGSAVSDYELVDTWMLGQRYREAVDLNQSEMDMYLLSCKRIIDQLKREIEERKVVDENGHRHVPHSAYEESCHSLQLAEIFRLENMVKSAKEIFGLAESDFNLDEDDCFIDEEEKGYYQELLLEAMETDDEEGAEDV